MECAGGLRASSGLVEFTGDALVLAPGNQTRVEVDLDQPREMRAGRRSGPVRTVRFNADDPAAAVAAITAAMRAHRSQPR